MAATLGCTPTRILCNAPVVGSRNAGEPSTSSIARLHLRGRRGYGGSKRSLSLKHADRQGASRGASLVRASLSNEGDKIRELASEKAVESGQQVAKDSKNLADGQSPVVLDAKAEDASDAASYDSGVREKVVDVASDTAVDTSDDVDALAKKDAVPLAEAYGRSIEDTAEALEAKAAEVSDREARKEGSSNSGESESSFFKDQLIKGKVLDVASATAVDEGSEVEATAQKDASDLTSEIGGDLRRNKATIQGLADTASKLEDDRSGSQQISEQFEGLKRTISKNLKEGIDSSRPGLEQLSRTASKSVKAGREYLDDAGEGAADISGDAQIVLDDAKGALDKRQTALNLAVEEARETSTLVAELAAKGWEAFSQTTEKVVASLQKNVGELRVTAQEKAGEAKQKAEETADEAQIRFAEAKRAAEEAAEQAQGKFAEAKSNLQAKTDELRDAAQERASESRSSLEKAAEEAQRKFDEARENVQTKTDELKSTIQERTSESRSKLEEATSEAQRKFEEAKENAQTKTDELKGTIQERTSESRSKLEEAAGEAQRKFEGAKENAQTKTDELKGTIQERTSESRSKLEEAAGEAQRKFEGAKENAQTKTGELKDAAQETAAGSKSKLEDTAEAAQAKVGAESNLQKDEGKFNGQPKGSESGGIAQTPGDDVSVQYSESGKVNDEWKGKAQ